MAVQPNSEQRTLASEVEGITGAPIPANPKRVVRTFAMDVAKLKGTAAPPRQEPPPPVAQTPVPKALPRKPLEFAPRPQQAPIPTPIPRSVPLPPAIASEPEPVPHLPPLSKEPPAAPAQPKEWEHIVEKPRESFISRLFASIFGTKNAASQTQEYAPPISTLKPPRRDADVPLPEQILGEEASEREAVLTRLRARVTASKATQPSAPPPVFPTPKPEISAPARAAYVPPETPETPGEPERLHTYTGDFSKQIDRQDASAFSVYAAQADAGRANGRMAPGAGKKNHTGLAYTLAGAVLLIGGSLIIYYGYSYFAGNQPVPVISTAPPALISYDEKVSVSGTGGALMQSLADAATTALPIGNVRVVYYADTATTTKPGGALVNALNLPAPGILLRNLGDTSTVGVVHAGDETRVFFVLAATSYERTFAGMLSWEPNMGRDLGALYPTYPITQDASSTKAVPAPQFVDEVVQSHDVRALKDAAGNTILLYGYRDQNTLIIARDETAFGVLLARISATAH